MDKDEKLLSSMFNLGRLIRQELFKNKCFCDLSHSEIEVLMFLKDSGTLTMKSIADYLHIKPSSVTPVIEKLVKIKVLKRTEDKKDRRIIYIGITQKGLKKIRKECDHIHKHIQKIFSGLNIKDKSVLIKILEKLIQKHEKSN